MKPLFLYAHSSAEMRAWIRHIRHALREFNRQDRPATAATVGRGSRSSRPPSAPAAASPERNGVASPASPATRAAAAAPLGDLKRKFREAVDEARPMLQDVQSAPIPNLHRAELFGLFQQATRGAVGDDERSSLCSRAAGGDESVARALTEAWQAFSTWKRREAMARFVEVWRQFRTVAEPHRRHVSFTEIV